MGFLNWLKNYSYLAGWFSPAIALIGMMIRGGGTKDNALDWARMMLYIAYLTSLAAVFTPVLDDSSRIFAGCGLAVLTIYFMVQSDHDATVHREAQRKAIGIISPQQ
ncbi:hypothetical protein [Tunturiibacter lichenicola]|uniref:hypothetical protein n=1 Tax=Tunturiibacter lichenicola TaxID=2051959 RepID=UPI003D9B10EE